jgi:hypothetical protein
VGNVGEVLHAACSPANDDPGLVPHAKSPPKTMIAPLFTETGIMPLRVRCLLIILNRWIYFLGLGKTQYARAALDSSFELRVEQKILGKRFMVRSA